jgi:predicted ATP-binding protein involved in virulence
MKIRKLHIKNYKVFDDIELDFTDANGKTLDKIVLAGVNGCGKTTVLELIKKMYNVERRKYSEEFGKSYIKAEFEISDSERKNLIDMYYSGTNPYNTKYFIFEYIAKDNSFDNSPHESFFIANYYSRNKFLSKLLYFPSKKEDILSDTIRLFHLDSDKDEMKTLALKDIRNEIFKNEDIPPRQSKEKAIKRITKALEGLTLTTKLVDLESEELIFESANGEKIKFEDLSSGEQNLYFRAIYLSTLNPQNSIIMIDEPEDSLHPTWQQKVMQLYQNIGENNQVIVATHSPHIIGSSKAEEVFLLQIDENKIEARHPRYTKGHSIDYVLDEIMGANSRDTSVIKLVDSYLALMRKGQHESAEGLKIKSEIDALNLDPNSEEMRGLNLSIKRIKAVGV